MHPWHLSYAEVPLCVAVNYDSERQVLLGHEGIVKSIVAIDENRIVSGTPVPVISACSSHLWKQGALMGL